MPMPDLAKHNAEAARDTTEASRAPGTFSAGAPGTAGAAAQYRAYINAQPKQSQGKGQVRAHRAHWSHLKAGL